MFLLKRFLISIFWLGFAVAQFGCSNNLPEFVQLGPLRVLAMQLASPEVDPGAGAVALNVVVSDLSGGGRALNITATQCVNLDILFGATPTCDDVTGAAVILATTGLTGLNAGNGFTAQITNGVNVISLPTFTGIPLDSNDLFNGVPVLVQVVIEVVATGETERAFKRLIVSNRPANNSNPTLTDILADGTALAAAPTVAVDLTADIAGGSEESFQYYDSGGSLLTGTEEAVTTWFISDGSVSAYRTLGAGVNSYDPPTESLLGPAQVFFAVTRDGRGGVSYSSEVF